MSATDTEAAGHDRRGCFKGNSNFFCQWEFALLSEQWEHLGIWPTVTGNAEELWSVSQTKAQLEAAECTDSEIYCFPLVLKTGRVSTSHLTARCGVLHKPVPMLCCWKMSPSLSLAQTVVVLQEQSGFVLQKASPVSDLQSKSFPGHFPQSFGSSPHSTSPHSLPMATSRGVILRLLLLS